MALTRAERDIAHLFRRAGFGATRAEVVKWAAAGREAAVNSLVDFDRVDNSALDTLVNAIDVWNNPDQATRSWLLRMAYTARPLEEKMTLFWHDHWACGLDKVENPLVMDEQNRLLRKMALPNWPKMCEAVSKNPAMLIYLDNTSNRKAAPNENYAREFLELHTLGEDVLYTQPDIREAARAFTGWSTTYDAPSRKALEKERDEKLKDTSLTDQQKQAIRREYAVKIAHILPLFAEKPKEHDTGAKTFLGRSGNFDGNDIISTVVARPEAARLICAKLYNWFVADGPVPASTLDQLVSLYFSSGYELKSVVRAILLSDDMYADRAYRAKTKSPVEFVAGMVRQLLMKTDGRFLVNAAKAMGQVLYQPPNPAGWPGGRTWINATTLLGRANNSATAGSARALPGKGDSWDPMAVIKAEGVSEAGQIVDLFLDILVDGVASTADRNVLAEYMHTDQDGSYRTFKLTEANVDLKVRGLVYLILASPAYNLA